MNRPCIQCTYFFGPRFRSQLTLSCHILSYPSRQVLHRENQKILTVLPDLFRELFIELNVVEHH